MTLLAQIHRHARLAPRRLALTGAGVSIDYAGLLAEVTAAMGLLRGLGARVVALDLDNGPSWVVLDLAAMALGLCLVPLPPFFSDAQRDHVLRQSGVQAILTDARGRQRERAGLARGNRERAERVAGQRVYILAGAEPDAGPATPIPRGVHKVTFTSGTTGTPKGVMLCWAQMRPVVQSLAATVGMQVDDRHLTLMPLAVLLENIGGVYVALWAGASVVLASPPEVGMSGSSQLDPVRLAAGLVETCASTAIFTPQTLQGLVEAVEAGAPMPGLRFAAVGGAPVSPQLLERAQAAGLSVYEGYGLSECCSVVCLNTATHNRSGSVGRPLPHVRVSISNDGEVLVRGQPFVGYLGEPPCDATEWYTGDLGELDAEGYLHLRGRRRNVFITGFGRNVAPEWVERELTLEPAITQAAVFGEARPYNVAVIVAASWAAASAIEAALARANLRLPDYARVTRWMAAVDDFSLANGLLTGTGRVRREALWERYGRDIEALYREVETS